MWDHCTIDVDINYWAFRIQIFWTDYLPQYQVGQLSFDIDGWGIYLVPSWMLKALLFDQPIIDRYIFYFLEK